MTGKLIGRYQLFNEVGFGGMGAVYQARDVKTDQLVAVKLLSIEYINDLGLRAAFEREAQLVTGLKHEAIVPVYEFGQADGQPYLIMQYMSNGSLAERLRLGVLSPEEVTPILDRLCRAIDYAHERGIIHRDLKPSNILFDEDGEAYLADFGIAWQMASRQAFSPVNGTPAYLSPEQALGEGEIDGRCDIYALGIILFEALTGKLPFEGQIPLAVVLKQIHDQAPSLRSVDWSLPAALDAVIQRALAKDPDERFSTGSELARAYRKALSGEAENLEADVQSAQLEEQIPAGSSGDQGTDAHNSAAVAEDPTAPQGGPEAPARMPDAHGRDFFDPWQVSIPEEWRLAHFLSLGLATFMGMLVAVSLTAFIYLPQRETLGSDGFIGMQLSFDRSSLVLANYTAEPQDLTDLSFRRIVPGDAPSAEFQAAHWIQVAKNEQLVLQPGACYLLLLPDAASFSLNPGQPLPALPGCDSLQGWLVVADPDSWFWLAEGDSRSFQVVFNGADVQTCSITSGKCRFSIASPITP